MDLIQIKPSTTLNFTLPDMLTFNFTLYNITLHQLDIHLYCTHPTNFIVYPNKFTMQSFDEKSVRVQLKYYQQSAVSNFLANKMVLYIYDRDQEGQLWSSEGISVTKFKKVQKIEFQLTCTANMQEYILKQPKKKELMVRMQRLSEGVITSKDKNEVVTYLEGLGNLESFHSLSGDVFLARYKSMSHSVSEIREVEGQNGFMILYAIGMQPWMVYPQIEKEEEQTSNKTNNTPKSSRSLKSQPQKQFSEENQMMKNTIKEESANQLTQQQIQQITHLKHLRQGIRIPSSNQLENTQDINLIMSHPAPQITSQQLQQILTEDDQATTTTLSKSRKNNVFESFADKGVKSSFSKRSGKRRNKSLQIKTRKPSQQIMQEQQDDEDYKRRFMQQQYSKKNPIVISEQQKPHLQNIQIINSIIKPLNLLLMPQGKFYILFEGFVMFYPSTEKIGTGQRIQLGILNCWTDKKTVMKNSQNYLVITCNSNFYIINLKSKKCFSSFVQRKQIMDFSTHEKENIIIFGGKTFSKLSLFGKQTGRSNIKTYSLQTQYHLFTFDLPEAGDIYHLGQFGITGSKIVVALGNDNRVSTLYCINVLSATKLQILSKFDMQDLGVAQIKQLTLSDNCIYILQDMRSQQSPLMFVKKFNIKLDDKLGISTQSLPITHGSYKGLTMDRRVIVLRDNINKGLVIYGLEKRKFVRVVFEEEPKKMEVSYPYLFIMYQTHIEVKRLKNLDVVG